MKKVSYNLTIFLYVVGILVTLLFIAAMAGNTISPIIAFIIIFFFNIYIFTRNFTKDEKNVKWLKYDFIDGKYTEAETTKIKSKAKICFSLVVIEALFLVYSFSVCNGIISVLEVLFLLSFLFFEAYSYLPLLTKKYWNEVEIGKENLIAQHKAFEERKNVLDAAIEETTKKYESKYGKITKSFIAREGNLLHVLALIFKEKQKLILVTLQKQYIIPFSSVSKCSLIDTNKTYRDSIASATTTTYETRTNSGSAIKRAAVGVLVGGVAGAAVGAMTAKKDTISTTNNPDGEAAFIPSDFMVRLSTKDLNYIDIDFPFGEDKEQARQFVSIINVVKTQETSDKLLDIIVEDIKI